MKAEFNAIIEKGDKYYIAYCPEIPGANGQGKTIEECLENLKDAIRLIFQDRIEEGLRGIPENAESQKIIVEV